LLERIDTDDVDLEDLLGKIAVMPESKIKELIRELTTR
jgi:hypothetical protein